MPLRDHFGSPVNDKHSWDEVHGQWPGEIVRQLFNLLPAGYQAAPKVHLGSTVEVDVGAFDSDSRKGEFRIDDGNDNVATLAKFDPTLTVEAELSEQDQYEVLIYDMERGRQLVAPSRSLARRTRTGQRIGSCSSARSHRCFRKT